jgi:O-antigen ligase
MEPLNFGNFLILVIGLSALQLRRARADGRRAPGAGWGTVLLAAIALFVIGVNSRGAILGSIAAAAALVVFVTTPRQMIAVMRVSLVWILVMSVAGGLFVQARYKGGLPVFAQYFASRLTSAVQAGNRVDQDWQLMAPLLEAHPLLGVGFGNLPFYWGRLEGSMPKGVTEAGGLYLRLLAEVGIIGTALYLAFVATLLLGLIRTGRRRSVAPEYRWSAVALFFVLAADAIQRVALVGIATDVHLWVEFGMAAALPQIAAANTTPEAS